MMIELEFDDGEEPSLTTLLCYSLPTVGALWGYTVYVFPWMKGGFIVETVPYDPSDVTGFEFLSAIELVERLASNEAAIERGGERRRVPLANVSMAGGEWLRPASAEQRRAGLRLVR